MVGLPKGEKNWGYNRLDTILACDRRTDGQTDILPRHSPHYAYACRAVVTPMPSVFSNRLSVRLFICHTLCTIQLIITIIPRQCLWCCLLSSWQSHCQISPDSFDYCRTAPSGRRPKAKPEWWLRLWVRLFRLPESTPTIAFIIITQPESWYSFYRPTVVEGWVDLVGCLHTDLVYPSTDGHLSW